MSDAVPPPHALLCESCGYPLAGLLTSRGNPVSPDALCPECGHPVARSMPERRPGSPWQRRPGLLSLAQTAAATLRHPDRSWQDLRVRGRTGAALVASYAAIIGPLAGLTFGWWLTPGSSVDLPGPIEIGAIVGASLIVVLIALTCIEAIGIRIIGRLRRWRITWPVAFTVVGHAAIGWALMPVTLPFAIDLLGRAIHGGGAPPGATGSSLSAIVPIIWGAAGTALFFAPMFAFEGLVYIGMRRLRFANAPRSA